MKKLITVAEQGDSKLPVISITEEAEEFRLGLLSESGEIEIISSESDRDLTISASSRIRSHLKEVEKLRTEIKAPYLEIGRRIDEAAKSHVKDLTSENKRLNQLVGEFEFKREQARLEAERAAEQARKVLEAGSQVDEEEKASVLSAVLDAEEMAVDAAPPTGGAMRQDWVIDVLDMKELFAKHPQCVRMEPDLLSIKDLLKKGIEVAGIRATPIWSYNVRAVSPNERLR